MTDYTNFIVIPLKIVGCWDWYQKPVNEYQIMINNVYLGLVLFTLTSLPMTLIVNLYTEWTNIMESLEKLADGLPLLASVAIVAYFACHKEELYDLVDFMNKNFKYHSARGLTNMTMAQSVKTAKNFALMYTGCTLFSVSMYVSLPMILHLWTKKPLSMWMYMDADRAPLLVIAFLRQALGQAFVGLAVGQLGVLFAANSILLCGQLDILCCSLRNARFTALLQTNVKYEALACAHKDWPCDEMHQYIYSKAEMQESGFNYDQEVRTVAGKKTRFDIYSPEFEAATLSALRDCERVSQVVKRYKDMFERFVSPLLVLRVVQVTLYLCVLLYAATDKFDMVTVEYLGAVALDIFVYCYFGNQIILQADRVSTAAYQCGWPALGLRARRTLLNILLATKRPLVVRAGRFLPMDLHTDRVSTAAYQCGWPALGLRARRTLLNILLATKRPLVVRAGRFLPMDLHTFIVIIKTSFSYYTLLKNVNEKK